MLSVPLLTRTYPFFDLSGTQITNRARPARFLVRMLMLQVVNLGEIKHQLPRLQDTCLPHPAQLNLLPLYRAAYVNDLAAAAAASTSGPPTNGSEKANRKMPAATITTSALARTGRNGALASSKNMILMTRR
jgi:hypothetical protein